MISVVIPTHNEGENLDAVIWLASQSPLVGEILVVDDGSTNGTQEAAMRAGARVIPSTVLGRAGSMADGLRAARGEVIVYLGGAFDSTDDHAIERLARPILAGQADLVKACSGPKANRLTTLTAKPLLATFFPELECISEPLNEAVAVHRPLLQQVTIALDGHVDLALLIDAHFAGARLAEVAVPAVRDDRQPLTQLDELATEVVRTIMHRAALYGRLSIDQVQTVDDADRRAKAELPAILQRVKGCDRVVLIDLDTELASVDPLRFVAGRVGRGSCVAAYRPDAAAVAQCLEGVSREQLVTAAREIPLRPGVVARVVNLRKQGYRVGVVSEGFDVVAEIIRRRVFADFSVGHHLHFASGHATGAVTEARQPLLLHLCQHLAIRPEQIVTVGDRLQAAGQMDELMRGVAEEVAEPMLV
jgi:glucosyl-3-phosphoglycerate synthase